MSCVSAVRTALQGVSGVKEVKIDFGKKEATVTVDPDQVTGEALTGALPDRFQGQVMN